jgi:hypothetical protein
VAKARRGQPLRALGRHAPPPPRLPPSPSFPASLLSLHPLTHQCPANTTTPTGVTGASSVDECVLICDPGTWALVTQGPAAECWPCREGFYCPGGPQTGELIGERGRRWRWRGEERRWRGEEVFWAGATGRCGPAARPTSHALPPLHHTQPPQQTASPARSASPRWATSPRTPRPASSSARRARTRPSRPGRASRAG